MFAAIIHAAGMSAKAGAARATIKVGSRSLIEVVAGHVKAAGAGPVYVVLPSSLAAGPEAKALTAAGCELVISPAGVAGGVLGSVQAALGKVSQDAWGALVVSVEHAAVKPATYKQILQTAQDSPGQLVVPKQGNRQGMPALFCAEVFNDLLMSKAGLAGVLDEYSYRTVETEVKDAAIHKVIDTAEEFAAAGGVA